ncbi:hypothetical protein B0H16DRAFT_1793417 [Mycena metata]|uniref:Uncharacterized protein n=1 Tax=Mycena metata TaxID=1033252 RepID=A0AAD7HGP5_9AGAR|nr:hypothetical protein B0H16DRAFT_1793417 [Mycena metata]
MELFFKFDGTLKAFVHLAKIAMLKLTAIYRLSITAPRLFSYISDILLTSESVIPLSAYAPGFLQLHPELVFLIISQNSHAPVRMLSHPPSSPLVLSKMLPFIAPHTVIPWVMSRARTKRRGTPVCVLNTKTAKSKPSGMRSRALLSNVEKLESDLSDLNRLLEEERKLSAFRMDAARVAVEELRAPVYQTTKELAQAARTLHALADRQTGFLLALGAPLALLSRLTGHQVHEVIKIESDEDKVHEQTPDLSTKDSQETLRQSPVLTTRQATSPTELTETSETPTELLEAVGRVPDGTDSARVVHRQEPPSDEKENGIPSSDVEEAVGAQQVTATAGTAEPEAALTASDRWTRTRSEL